MLFPGGEQEGFIPSFIPSLFVCSRNSDRRNFMLQVEEKNEELRHFCLAFASLHHGPVKYLT